MEARKSGKNMDCDMMTAVVELREGTGRERRGLGNGCEKMEWVHQGKVRLEENLLSGYLNGLTLESHCIQLFSLRASEKIL